jgi:hypothetical protein
VKFAFTSKEDEEVKDDEKEKRLHSSPRARHYKE